MNITNGILRLASTWRMKTTIDFPDALLAQVGALASSRGMSVERFVTEALEEHLRRCGDAPAGRGPEPPWMAGFGELSDLAGENRRILALIEEEFGLRAEPEDCR